MSALNAACQQVIERALNASIHQIQMISGGSINQARLVKTSRGPFFLKFNNTPSAKALFEAEVRGLKSLAKTQSIRIPDILLQGRGSGQEFLLLEYIAPDTASPTFWEKFGHALAELHRHSQAHFGGNPDNFIGSLPQSNGSGETWAIFYWQERLLPQLRLAEKRGLLQKEDWRGFENMQKQFDDLFPVEAPALIHGDLWSGNFIAAQEAQPILIDPSVSWAHREMDLAMSRLFGGFAERFYEAYAENWPLAPGLKERLAYYQLYYLLVHLNLFGNSYWPAIKNIIRRF